MAKVNCEDCYEVEAQIVYLVRNVEWRSCFECLTEAVKDKECQRVMLMAVDEAED